MGGIISLHAELHNQGVCLSLTIQGSCPASTRRRDTLLLTAAIYLQPLPCDESGEVGGKEENGASDVVGNAQTPHGCVFEDCVPLGFGRPRMLMYSPEGYNVQE